MCKIDSQLGVHGLMMQGDQSSALKQPRGVGPGGGQEGGAICIPVADSCDIRQEPTQQCKAIILQWKC